jgi:hypothetical protein
VTPRGLLGLCAAGIALTCRDPAPERDLPQPMHRIRELRQPPVRPISIRELCVSSGKLHATADARWLSTRPALRATAALSAGHHAALEFRYLGSTEQEKRLGSGNRRRQLGLKLLSRDSCNVVYAMWRFDEPASVVASVKANPDLARHSECGNRGYENLRPLWKARVEPPQLGSVHELSATLQRGLLEVRIDQRPVLRAFVGVPRAPTSGLSGLRSDNVSFELLRFEADVPEGRGARQGDCPG